MRRRGPGTTRGQHRPACPSISASALASGAERENRDNWERLRCHQHNQHISTPRHLTHGVLDKNSDPATISRTRNGVSKLNRADCFCDTESNKKAKSLFKVRPRSELQQNTMYVSSAAAPVYRGGPPPAYQGFRPVQTAAASWSGYQVCLTS